ncbi:MAG: beta-N-acetylglucosaminidase [Owenweeksia sp.]|nr:beta-N-acetylglucosaminidase [Owenweeksia sp.]|tara:strand:- start:1583 stop:4543 length:2961 start_codon:yes stop_codon:yes gene_type:complete
MKLTLRSFFLFALFISGPGMGIYAQVIRPSVIWEGDTSWAREKLKNMSMDEKLGQLFMIAAYSNKGKAHQDEIINLVKNEHIGGLIFFQGGPQKQARLTNIYQQGAKIPLMIAMDAEWGLSMRLDSTFKFPWPLTVGATRDSALAYRMGAEIAKHSKRLGVHINFGPVTDINTNPENPIINARSFGEDPENVTRLSEAYMKGMQDQHVLACAKHFPGHGDTDSDSHKTLPTVSHNMERLNSVELKPYGGLINKGLGSVMVAHLNVPALDNTGTPTSLSKKVITDHLKQQMGFTGLVFTDALNMKGVADLYPPGEVDVRALLAGNDVLLFSEDVKTAKEKIRDALKAGRITEEEINDRVYRILLTKSWMGLEQKEHIESKNLIEDLNPESSHILNRDIYRNAVTVVVNRDKMVPVSDLRDKKIACVTAGTDPGSEFAKTLKYYAKVDEYRLTDNNDTELISKLSQYDLVIVGVYTSNANPWKSYKISSSIRTFVKRLSLQNSIILNLFANPYALSSFPEAEYASAVMISYQNHPDAESLAAQIIFGAEGAQGRLPVSTTSLFDEGFGISTPSLHRMGYGLPGEVGMDKDKLEKIDLLVDEAIRNRATPGCQLLVARKGKVIFHRTYGSHTYSRNHPVSEFDLYDLASITKMAASVPMLMKLVEENKIDLDKTLGDYLPQARGTNKEKLVIREILAHQARLQAWIPFYLETLSKGQQLPEYYAVERNFDFPNSVAIDLYSTRSVRDTILARIYDSKLLPQKEYKYSDLGYYLFMDLIEQVEGEPLDVLVDKNFYRPLGAYTMTYRPLEKFPEDQIVPTEDDKTFRRQELRGYVHDQGAAMLGGVAGHAGLFSDANDLAKLMQMYLQYGKYGGVEYFDSVTVKEFTRCQYCDDDNRRGIGFDKPQLGGAGPTCGCVSPLSFGHTGFTGTIAWADPTEEIVYIFLSNRVHPDAENRKLLSLSTRTRIQEVIYNSIKDENAVRTLISDVQP